MGMQVFRHVVPIDDRDHVILMPPTRIVKVGCRRSDLVEFWYLHTGADDITRTFRVFGTGHPVYDAYTYVGTAEPTADGSLVWHLFEDVGA